MTNKAFTRLNELACCGKIGMSSYLGHYRVMSGLSIGELANMAHVSKSSIYEIEKGRSPRVDTLLKITNAMGASIIVALQARQHELK